MQPKGRLLIVEDEPALREVLQSDLLEVADIEFASNGLEAIELIQSRKFDAILSDVKMPKMTGMELLKWFREHNYKVPFIVLTGFGDKKLVLEALQLGAYNFLDKPPKIDELIKIVGKAIEIGMQFEVWQNEFQENSIAELIKDNSARAQRMLAKELGMPSEYFNNLKESLLKKY